jgi:hypothetical protein
MLRYQKEETVLPRRKMDPYYQQRDIKDMFASLVCEVFLAEEMRVTGCFSVPFSASQPTALRSMR